MGNTGKVNELNIKMLQIGIMPKGMLDWNRRRSVSPMGRGDGGWGEEWWVWVCEGGEDFTIV